MNTYDYEYELFLIDPRLQDYRDLKEFYAQFNSRNAGKSLDGQRELNELIITYRRSKHFIFCDFGDLLIKYHDPIINSFIMVKKYGKGNIYDSRLYNGPIESLNRKVKDLKRLGISNTSTTVFYMKPERIWFLTGHQNTIRFNTSRTKTTKI